MENSFLPCGFLGAVRDTDQADRQREWREGGAGALESGKAGIKT